MRTNKHLSRTKHAGDVLEHVLEGVQMIVEGPNSAHARTRVVVDSDARPWIGGVVTSAVEITVLALRGDD
jgi:hypothetical protein